MSVTWGLDPKAKRISVYYEGTNTIYEGMALCYNHDTTTNHIGVASIDFTTTAGSVSESTTTAEGSQNEGKFIRVEEPSAANQRFFAGVVAGGKHEGSVGPAWVDVYAPNGAIVPVYTDKSVTINDKAHLEIGENTVIDDATAGGPCIGFFDETIDRSSTAGLALCKLTDVDASEIKSASTLSVGLSPLLWGDAPSVAELADPGNGISYFDDFIGAVNTTTAEGWIITQTTTGTMLATPVEGGALLLDTAGHTGADDGIECQKLNCRFLPKVGTNIWFEARVKMNDATDQYFVGLAATDTTLLPAGAADDAVDKCGFYHLAASTDNKLSSITARTTADDLTADVVTNTDGAYITLGFKITGLTSVKFYADGALVETGVTTANIPNAAMCLSLVCKTEGTDVDAEMTVDWVKIVQDVARA